MPFGVNKVGIRMLHDLDEGLMSRSSCYQGGRANNVSYSDHLIYGVRASELACYAQCLLQMIGKEDTYNI